MSENKPKYILCPRCELNYIEESEGYCKVCKAAMGLLDPSILIPEEEELTGEKLCPVCKVNYIGEDEDVCFLCKREREAKEAAEDTEDAWMNFVDEEVPEESEDMADISLSELAEEEDEDEEEDEEENSPDDFDYDIDDDDFEDVDDEEDEDEDEEDDEEAEDDK